MGWKNLSYAMRGGVIGFLVGLVSFFFWRLGIVLMASKSVQFIGVILISLGFIAIIMSLPYYIFFEKAIERSLGIECWSDWFDKWCNYGSNSKFLVEIILPGLFVLLFSFLIGYFLGRIVGKFKNKKGVNE